MICFQPFKKFFDFFGRANRWEFWSFYVFIIIMQCAFVYVDEYIGIHIQSGPFEGSGLLTTLFLLITAIPQLTVSVRRLHDTDRRGWWVLIVLVPLIGIVALFILYLLEGTPEENRFGSVPG